MTSSSEKPPMKAKTSKYLKSNTPRQPIQKTRVAQLIGKRCMVSCSVNGVPHQMLLDTGAQVTIVGRAWVEKALPDVKIQPLESLLAKQPLEISAANGTEVPYDGWAEIDLQIGSPSQEQVAIKVPVLISQSCTCSLLGSNVIAEIIKENAEQGDQVDVIAVLKEALSVSESTVEALVSALEIMASDETPPQCNVKVGKKGINIPAGQVCEVRCRVRGGQGVVHCCFSPVQRITAQRV